MPVREQLSYSASNYSSSSLTILFFQFFDDKPINIFYLKEYIFQNYRFIYIILSDYLRGQYSVPFCNMAQEIQKDVEREMIEEINLLRQDPKGYVQYVLSYIEERESSIGEIKEANILIKILSKTKPLNPLAYSELLYLDGCKHGKWMLDKNSFKHSKLPYAENLVCGEASVRFSVISLLVDYGVPSKGHRLNLLNKNYTKVACINLERGIKECYNVFIQEFD